MNDETQTKPKWLEKISNALLREPTDGEELLNLLRDAEQRDILNSDALIMIEGVLQVSEMQVREVMIPRGQMVVIEHDAKPKTFLPIVIESHHSRFPVIGENGEDVAGILMAKDLLRYSFSEKENFNIRDVLRPAVFVPESKRLDVLLKEFRLNRNHMAIVIDEYGGTAGLVTIEDVLEQIVGEIEDEYDTEEDETNIKKLNEKQFTVKALTPIDDFNETFNTNFNHDDYDTVGGLLLSVFSHLPIRGEMITIEKLHFKVLHANKRRIGLLRVTVKD